MTFQAYLDHIQAKTGKTPEDFRVLAAQQGLTQYIAKLFAGNKERWRKSYETLMAKLDKSGTGVSAAPTNTYISLLRSGKKFGIVQPSSAERLDIGIKLKGVEPTDRFEAAGSWNARVTHRVRIADEKQIDKEVLNWLKRAYEAAA